MIPHFFIDRPIFASVLSIVIVVLGLVSLQGLPIAQFPEITPPVIQIDADYPGASAEVIADSVARPIEVQLPGIDNLLYYDSTSTNDGHMTIKLTFEIGTNVDIAQVQTQNRQKLAEPQLPPEVVRQGISVKKVSPDLLAVVALSSSDPTKDTVFVSNYALLNVIDNLKRLRGVGDAVVFGGQNYSMRLILDPTRMAQLSLTPTDIANVVREQNRDFPAGTIGREPAPKGTELTIPVITQGRLTDVKDFEEMIVRALPDGSMIRLKDVAKIELGAQSYSLEGRWNGKPNVFLLTFLSPGANALDTVKRVRKEMDAVSKSFPHGGLLRYSVRYDQIYRSVHPRSGQDPGGSDGAGHPRRVSVPPKLARDADPGRGCAGFPHRYLCRHAGTRLFDQYPHPLWDGPCHRDGGRRRHRGGGERRAPHGRGTFAEGCRQEGDG